jgi:hypothetical protein
MESKLTLKLDSVTINKAKRYVYKHKGMSLSRLVESVSSLAGIAKKVKNRDLKDEYTEYLVEKYQ